MMPQLIFLTFDCLLDLRLAHSLTIHLHNTLHNLFVLRLVVGLIWIDPFGVAHHQRGPIWVQTVEGRLVGDASSIAHMVLTLFVVFHA